MTYCNFGDVLRALRRSRNLTQKELGAQLGLSKAVISKYETGMGYPTLDSLIAVAKFFGVSTDYLLGVEKNIGVDVSRLTAAQQEAVRRVVEELIKSNEAKR